MDSTLDVLLIVLLGLPVAVLATLFSNPGGLLVALLTTRRQRYEHRHRLANRRWRARSRQQQRSSRISSHLRRMVERADRRTCVACGARWGKGQDRFPVDHMVPWIMGGLTCLWNSALLCKSCNSIKSCYWVAPSGREYYRGRRKPPAYAKIVLAAEYANRRGLARWLRAFGLLPSW
jgi:5-methylcytosine-specific restriction endonuclease McrA